MSKIENNHLNDDAACRKLYNALSAFCMWTFPPQDLAVMRSVEHIPTDESRTKAEINHARQSLSLFHKLNCPHVLAEQKAPTVQNDNPVSGTAKPRGC